MLIVLKLTCFGLWMAMMLGLCLADRLAPQKTISVSLMLIDPGRAERDIQLVLARIFPQARLCLEISCQNPYGPELLYIANCAQRKNPSIMIHTEVQVSTLPSLYY
jgi:hypothetical protein